eukprot:507315_1
MRSLLFIIGSSLLLDSGFGLATRTHLQNHLFKSCLSVHGVAQQVIMATCSDSDDAQLWNELPGNHAMWQNDKTKLCLGLRTYDFTNWYPQMLACGMLYTNWKTVSYHSYGIFLMENSDVYISTVSVKRGCLYYNTNGNRFQTTTTCGRYEDQWWYSGASGKTIKPASANTDMVPYEPQTPKQTYPYYINWLFGLITVLLLINLFCYVYFYKCNKKNMYLPVKYVDSEFD